MFDSGFHSDDKSKLNDFSISLSIIDLEETKKIIKNIKYQYELLEKVIKQIIKYPLKESENLLKEIDDYTNWLNMKNNLTKDNYLTYSKNLRKKFDCYYTSISTVYTNNFNEKIKSLNEDLKNNIDNIIQFDPSSFCESNTNNTSNTNLEDEILKALYDSRYENFYSSNLDIKENKREIETNLKCNFCNGDNVFYYCQHCNLIFCEDCQQTIINYQNNKLSIKSLEVHNLEKLSQVKAENEEKKRQFMESFINIFKKFTFKCSYIMKNENVNYVDKDSFKKFQYPFLSNEDNFESIKKFLEDINEVENIIKEKIDTNNKINNREISLLLKEKIKDALNLENTLKEIDSNFNLKDDKDNNSEDSFVNEKYKIGEEEEEEEQTKDNNNEIIKDSFKYILYIINNKNDSINNNQIIDLIKEKIIKALGIKKENLSVLPYKRISFINDFIKTKEFSQLSLKSIRKNYPKLKLLYEFKLLIDGFIRYKCQISEKKLNYGYNFIIPNLSLTNERYKEIYNPPYGWMGVALNVEELYKNQDLTWLNKDSRLWAVCYYGYDFRNNFDSNQNCQILKDIIDKNVLPKSNFSIKFDYSDIRNNGKKIGNGYYLSPYIEIAEKYSGIISLNQKKYKIVLMAKVLIEKIKEPDDGTFWIVQDIKNIRFYRILFKEVKNNKRRKKQML